MTTRVIPLTCSGHTRPVVHLSFSRLQEEDGKYLLVSSCKDGSPMLRDWQGDWIGTFIGSSSRASIAFAIFHPFTQLQATRERCGAPSSALTRQKQPLAAPTLLRKP